MIWAWGLFGALLTTTAAAPFAREALRKPVSDTARTAAPGAMIDLPQGATYYRWRGRETGPVAVCVHGLTTPSAVWDNVADGLATMGFRVLTYDLYGRGLSAQARGPQDAAFFTRQLHDLLGALPRGRRYHPAGLFDGRCHRARLCRRAPVPFVPVGADRARRPGP